MKDPGTYYPMTGYAIAQTATYFSQYVPLEARLFKNHFDFSSWSTLNSSMFNNGFYSLLHQTQMFARSRESKASLEHLLRDISPIIQVPFIIHYQGFYCENIGRIFY